MEWTRSPTFLDTILHTIWMSFLLFTKLSSSKYLTGIRFALRISSPFSVDFSSIFSAILRRLRDQSLSSTKYFRIASSKLILASKLELADGNSIIFLSFAVSKLDSPIYNVHECCIIHSSQNKSILFSLTATMILRNYKRQRYINQ